MSKPSLQPANRSWLEKSLEEGTDRTFSVGVPIREVFKPHDCPVEFLPFLAWAQSIADEEGWSFAESEEARRNLIARSTEIHKKKGTIWSIREVFRMLGLGEVSILENIGRLRHDGTFNYDGTMVHGGDASSTWATYIVKLNVPITNEQAEIVRKILAGIAPARSELTSLDFKSVAIRHNSVASRDGTYNYGSA